METHAEEIAVLQRAVWMAEKLARLCRELLDARKKDEKRDVQRLEEEISVHIHSTAFAQTVEKIGAEYFYPDRLRVLCYLLEHGYADTLEEAQRTLDKMEK
ncbi:MAG: hypothetical protein IJC71_02225 [Clostridia bacterium]|nr:hypothetical protein [Clostridia bacterium]